MSKITDEAAFRVCASAKLVDQNGNGAMNYIVAPYLIDDLLTTLSAASALTAGEREPVEHQWRGKEGGVMLEKARDALETAADKILSDYRIWIADDTEAKPRYGQIPEYDMVNAVSGEIDRHLRSSALEATPPAPKVTEGHPMQPVVVSEHGIHRFKSNKCVEALLDHGQKTGFGLNELARQEHTAEDRMQLAQLIGYSVSGYGDLSYVSDASYDLAAKQSQTLTAAQEAGKP